jgi:hypothetical protein
MGLRCAGSRPFPTGAPNRTARQRLPPWWSHTVRSGWNVSLVADPAKNFLVIMMDGRMHEDTRPR